MKVREEKKKLREKIWKILEEKKVARFPFPIRGRIPNFEGSERAAEKLLELEDWRKAKIVFVSPDSPQRKVRELVLKSGKILIMATPRLKQGFLEIKNVKNFEFASTIKGAFKVGKFLKELPKIDLVVIGSVAVDKVGWRLGKGGGYGDREVAEITKKSGKVPIITTVHDLQIVEKVPHEPHDVKVDYILTPTRIIKTEKF